jgi:hypothetical protein
LEIRAAIGSDFFAGLALASTLGFGLGAVVWADAGPVMSAAARTANGAKRIDFTNKRQQFIA